MNGPALKRPTPSLLFALAVAIQFATLTGMTVKKMIPVWTGERVLLKPVPRDPMDLFRGQYVRLSFPFETIDVRRGRSEFDAVASEVMPEPGRDLLPTPVEVDLPAEAIGGRRHVPVYLLLARSPTDEAEWRPVYVGMEPRPAGPGRILLKAKLGYYDRDRSVSLSVGLDAYYVTEGDGPRIEAALRGSDRRFNAEGASEAPRPPVTVEVYVDSGGNATMTGLFIGNDRY